MTTPIAPANSTPALRISERPTRQQRDGHPADARSQNQGDGDAHPQPAHEQPEPPLDESPVEAETLFAAQLMGESLSQPAPHPDSRKPPHWEPPESALRLTDKKI